MGGLVEPHLVRRNAFEHPTAHDERRECLEGADGEHPRVGSPDASLQLGFAQRVLEPGDEDLLAAPEPIDEVGQQQLGVVVEQRAQQGVLAQLLENGAREPHDVGPRRAFTGGTGHVSEFSGHARVVVDQRVAHEFVE